MLKLLRESSWVQHLDSCRPHFTFSGMKALLSVALTFLCHLGHCAKIYLPTLFLACSCGPQSPEAPAALLVLLLGTRHQPPPPPRLLWGLRVDRSGVQLQRSPHVADLRDF